MAKKGKEQQKHVASKHVTSRRLARWQREKRRQQITLLSGIVIIVIITGIIIGGVAATRSSDWLSTVQTDSGTITIKKADYANELKLFQVGIYNSSAMTNESPLSIIEDTYLIKDKAKEVKVNVSKTEIDNVILTSFGMSNKSISDPNFQTAYKNVLSNFSISDEDFRGIMENSLLNTKMQVYFVNQTPVSGEQAAMETIIVFNESDANDVTQRWRSGEEFAALSAEYGNNSQSGWVPKGYIGGDFDNVAFTIEVGNISDPISIANVSDTTGTPAGYYVIKLLERKDDVISDDMRQTWGEKEYNIWYLQAQQDKVQRNPALDFAELYAWAVKQLS
jgi:hypothetical protein